ncbi:NAD-P-binding protein [Schizophyllum commune]
MSDSLFSLRTSSLWSHPLLLALPALYILHKTLRRPTRLRKVTHDEERVLILGASSGIGRAIAEKYAKRGARVCIVGRRQDQVDEVILLCTGLSPTGTDNTILGTAADFANAEDLVKIREQIQAEWGGLDTLVVAAGVSALRPLMEVAGVETTKSGFLPDHASLEGIQKASEVASAAIHSNYIGPLMSAVTFIPLLSQTSKAPSILLISSLASVIPAPTRSIYASTKGASLLLYQSLAIEHPNIAFSHIMPSTVEGDFRASAVDAGPVREANPNKHGLKREYVAERCIRAVDERQRTVFLPWTMRVGHLLYWLWPAFVERQARKKYNFETQG